MCNPAGEVSLDHLVCFLEEQTLLKIVRRGFHMIVAVGDLLRHIGDVSPVRIADCYDHKEARLN